MVQIRGLALMRPFVPALSLLASCSPTMGRCESNVVFDDAGDALSVDAPGWSLVLDKRTGAIRSIKDRRAKDILLRGSENLWAIERHKQPDLIASEFSMQAEWAGYDDRLTLKYEGPAAHVTITCQAADQGPLWLAAVEMRQGTMLGWRFPDSIEFDVASLRHFVMPDNLGLAFSRSFFQGDAGVERKMLANQGLLRVAGDRCQMRPVEDAPVAARPGKDAEGWLPAWYRSELANWKVTANRCPTAGVHDLDLVETEHGVWLSGYQLGGWGWLFRFGGMLQASDSRAQMASVIATLAKIHATPPTSAGDVPIPADLVGRPPSAWPGSPRKIGILVGRPSSTPGSRQPQGADSLTAELGRMPWLRDSKLQLVPLRDTEEVKAALMQPRRWFAVINLVREAIPADSEADVTPMLNAVRSYVRNGGVWWDAGGGYSFFHAIVPAQNAVFRTSNRHFCDFAALESEYGRWSLFGIQSPGEIYVPPEAKVESIGPPAARVGRYTHRFHVWGTPDGPIRIPAQQMVLGTPHRDVLAELAKRNQYHRTLTDKASPELVERLKRSILLKVTGRSLTRSTRIAEQLPYPVLFHVADYLYGGFDKQYPDHLPPNPQVGTPEELSRLIQVCQDKGHLFMPYTNPSWWCTNPPGPTFQRVGDAPLSRDLQGDVYPERYGEAHTQGFSICAWHEEVKAANRTTRRQFTHEYPVDVLFQDQVGARGTKWDTNAAAPHPGAYLEGIHRIAQEDSHFVPLGTEDGHARLINYEAIFSGLSWPWLPNEPRHPRVLYSDLWPQRSWKIEPLALFLAHDKVLFYHHDLGGFVRDRLDLSMTLVMGYGLSWWTLTDSPSDAERDWLERLCRLQAAIGPRCAGRSLVAFDYLAPEVIRSRWDDLEITANLADTAWKIDASTVIAPRGFLARSADLEAGVLQGKDRRCVWTIKELNGSAWQHWSAGPEL